MKNKTWWLVGIGLGLVALFFLPGVLMGRWGGGYVGWMGPAMMGGGMMGRSFGTYTPFSFIFMGLMWLIPLGLLGLVIAGAAALFTALTRTGRRSAGAATRKCPECGRDAQADWSTCPYCGKALG
jgi:hypothetical protein